MMAPSSWILLFTLFCVGSVGLSLGNTYTNKFAVHIPGGERHAREVAETHGYVNIGHIGSLKDHYLFEHPHVHRRSALHSTEHHEKLSSHPHVQWFEQQTHLSRKKRDYLEKPDHAQRSSEHRLRSKRSSYSYPRRDVSQDDLKFNDELYQNMWYFNGGGRDHTDMNVKGAWRKGVTGKNVVITILDDGIERNHEDLVDNYDPYASYDVNGHDPDPMPRYDYSNENRHGTRCAGEVSAKANNTKCIVGVAYDSKIGGVRMLDGDVYDAVEAQSLSHNRSHIDIYSASWGPDDDGRVVDGPGVLAKKAFIEGVTLGRNGKGSIFVWASGNGGNQHDSCNCDGYTNSIYTLSISSISQEGRKPWYLEECSSTLATTYSSGTYAEKQIVSVDLHNKCTETHTGTSASAPLAAGIVALILEVNPGLTWRDVQYITLMTARPLPDGDWITNGVGRKVSLRYGYGLMDATEMVNLAEKWTNIPAQHICTIQSENARADKAKVLIPDTGYEEVLNTNACAGTSDAVNFLEHVQAKITLKSKRRGDIVIHLTSPSGTKSTILPQRPNDSDRSKGFSDWAFLSVHFWGENPSGQWKLQIEVVSNPNAYIGSSYGSSQTTNDLIDWSLILHGTEENPVNLVAPSQTEKPKLTPTIAGCDGQCNEGCSGPGPSQCNRCKNFVVKETGVCVGTCPNNYYLDGVECKLCNDTCLTCTLVASKVMCLLCKPGYLFVEGKGTCEKFCEKGYFKNNDNHHCRVCSGKCAECVEHSKCTSCREGESLVKDTCETVKECPAGEYLTDTGCLACPAGCFSCSSATNCTCCDKGSYLQNGSCVNSCASGFLPFHVNYSSKFIFQQCQHCGDKCNVCPEGFNYVNGVCVQQNNCPDGTYFQWNAMSCKSCSPNCRACIGPSRTDCIACESPYGYNSLQRKCVICCSDIEWQAGKTDCCKCIEEGKCDVATPPPVSNQASELFSVATLIIVLLVIVISCLSIIVFIAVWVGCRRNKTSHSNIRYDKLPNGEENVEF
ncbi:furin-like protease kpc-1 isoform X1 [Dreissena polymorpha]|uniref:furin-like protease kpc-1 isoform X1 n=1 Tax=Dreissena polymorpha TaxID=45954 RepID=UPI0022646E61|nr:furin-like protease kpc-1 isoform X1 [Dreissena polymorpha]